MEDKSFWNENFQKSKQEAKGDTESFRQPNSNIWNIRRAKKRMAICRL